MTTTHRRRPRILAGVVAATTAFLGLAFGGPAEATSTVGTRRVFGANRYGTAAQIASDTALGTPTGAIVATGENYPDALAAATLAGANGPAPIILTQSATYTSDAKSALSTLKGKGVSAVTVVGGPAAVSDEVKNQIASDGFTVTRIGGADRYATAAQIASAAATKQTGGVGLVGGKKTALFATGENFPDALAGGPIAERYDLPILLVTQATVPQSTQDAIKSLGITNAIVLGGTAAVSDSVKTLLGSLTGDSDVERLFGANRNGTAAAIGDYEVGTLSFPVTTSVLATGLNFPDALSAGVLAGVIGAPVILTASLPADSQSFLDRNSATIANLIAVGGTSVISDADVAAAKTAAQTTSNDVNLTAAPELLRVESAGTDSSTGGPVLRFVFDEALNSSPLTSGNFKAWTPYGESATGTAASLVSGTPTTVNVLFGVGSTTIVNEATLYTVAPGAVQDLSSVSNPEGKVNAAANREYAAGNTRAPDLLSVAAVSGATETYDFTFDTTITSSAATSYLMVDSDGLTRSGSSATQTGAVVRVVFSAAPASGQTGTRGVALAGAANGDTANGGVAANVLQAKSVTGRATGTDGPDLASVTFDLTGGQTALFTFDEAVETLSGTGAQGSASGFQLFYRNGTIATAISAERTSSNAVTAVFSASTNLAVNDLVAGGIVTQGAVARSGSTTSVKPNRPDSVGRTSSFAPGDFLGPKLVSVTRTTQTTLGGTPTGYKLSYVFDQNLTTTLLQNGVAGFYVIAADGTRVAITSSYCSRSADVTTTINCDSSLSSDTTSTAAVAMKDARAASVGASTVTGTKVRFVAGTTYTSSSSNHEEISSL